MPLMARSVFPAMLFGRNTIYIRTTDLTLTYVQHSLRALSLLRPHSSVQSPPFEQGVNFGFGSPEFDILGHRIVASPGENIPSE